MAEQQGHRKVEHQQQHTAFMAYLDGLLAALDLLYLRLGQGDPLPKGLQLAPTQLYSLGDPIKDKNGEMGCYFELGSFCAPGPSPSPGLRRSTRYNLPVGLVLVPSDLCLPLLCSPRGLETLCHELQTEKALFWRPHAPSETI